MMHGWHVRRHLLTQRRCFSTVQTERRQIRIADDVTLHALHVRPSTSTSSSPIVLLPGAFGSVENDFRHQLAVLGTTYELIGIDPRGYGRSRPPQRDFPSNYFERDADDIAHAMRELGYEKFNVLGWSAGANTAAVLTAKNPTVVDRLVLVSGNAFVTNEDIEAYETYADPSQWHPHVRDQAEQLYGKETFQTEVAQMIAKLRQIVEDDGDLYCGFLPRIQSKTLVVAGGKDKLVADFHGEYLSERIMHSRLHVFPQGRHDVQASDAEAFNALITAFLQEPDDKLTQSREYVARPVK